MAVSTRWGIGLSPDSVLYVGAARSLLSGHGLSVPTYFGNFVPMVQWPPLFPALLAVSGLIGVDPIVGAKWLNILLFAANISLAGLAVSRLSRSFWLPVLASFLAMISFPLVQVHSMAWSEPLFIFFGFLGLILLAIYIQKGGLLCLAASATAIALACVARYAGLALVLTGCMGAVVLSRSGWKRRLADATVFCVLSSFPILLWLVRNLLVADTATSKKIVFHPLREEHLKSAVDAISSWLLPLNVMPQSSWSRMIIVAVMMIVIFLLRHRQSGRDDTKRRKKQEPLPTLLLVFVISYGLLLVVWIAFFDAHTPIDTRILSPVFFATFLLLMRASVLEKPGQSWIFRMATTVLLVSFLLCQLPQSGSWLSYSYSQGFGYASRGWKESRILMRLRALDARTPIFTNGPDAVYVLAGRPALMIPAKADPGTRLPNGNYSSELAKLKKEIETRKGILVYFTTIRWRWYLPSEMELSDKLPLRLMTREDDGSIYRIESN